MPPEPLPWDRKDFFKERKHERSEFLGPASRWRDSSNHGSREFSRWGSGDFRRLPGHGRQGSWHLFSDEYGHSYGPSMSFGNKMLESASSRSSLSHGEGKYARNGRENRSFSQRDWKGHSLSTSNGSNNNCGGMHHDLNYDQRSVHEMLIYPSHSHSDFVDSRDKVKSQHDKISDANGLGTNQRRDREYSLSSSGWKPLKWTRPGGLCSRGSASGPSSSTKSVDALNSNEAKSKIETKNVTQDMSPSADPAAPPFDETTARKKPRLGWGEGLAKYEKKKVETPDSAGFSIVNAESTHSLSSSMIENGSRGSGFSDCTSPATPSSVLFGSSPGGDEKSSGKAGNIDHNVSNLHGSPGSAFQNQNEGPFFNLEKLDNFSIASCESPLIQLLQSNDSVSVDSSFVASIAMNKLLTYKNEISKVLEMTESEIDFLENELKGLRPENRGCLTYPSVSRAFLVGDRCFEEHRDASSSITPPAIPVVVNPGESNFKKMVVSVAESEEMHADMKGEDIYMSGRLMESVDVREKLLISGCNFEDNVVASIDSGILVESDAVPSPPISNDVHESSGKGYSMLNLILASNKESAYRAAEALNSLLPASEHKVDMWSSNVPCSSSRPLIEERFAKRKHLLRFKERVFTLKYRAFQSFWKENLHGPSVRKLRLKSQKKYQSSLWTNHSGYQKSRSSIRFRLPSPAGNLNPVPTMEILKHMSKQLSYSSQAKLYRKTTKMPALILDPKDKMASKFISTNGLVEDPCAVEKERMMINPWTSEEKDVFMDKLASFGKDFRKIASFLNHKTTADCIEFYYKNHKSDCFEKTKKVEFGKKAKSSTSAYLVTTGKKWNPEMNTASLDMLGAASVMTACAHENVGNQHKYSSRLGGRTEYHTIQVDDSLSEGAKSSDTLGNEREKVAADVLAGISSSLSSEAMGSCITNNFGRREGSQELKCRKGSATVLRWRTKANIRPEVDDETYSDESCGEVESSYWTDVEKSLFIEAEAAYGKNFSMISTYVGTKSTDQCKVFFSKARKCLGLDLVGTGNKKASGNDDDSNGDGGDANELNVEACGDTIDACMLESGSIACCEGGCQMIEDLPKLGSSIIVEGSDPMKTTKTKSTHQKLQENISSSENFHTDVVVDTVVSDACSREDSCRLAFDDVYDKNDSVHHQQPAAVCMNSENAREQDVSSPEAALVGNSAIGYGLPHMNVLATAKESDVEPRRQEERRNVDISDQGDSCCLSQIGKACSPTADSSSALDVNVHQDAVVLDSSKSSHLKLLPQHEQRCHDVRVSLSDSDQPCRNVDVKLFGQILTHPSMQKSKSGSNENGNRTEICHKFKRRLKVSHGNLVTAKFDLNNSPSQEDVPSRSYGIWDGNRILCGLSSLPDPAILMAQYPSAFDHHSMSASEIQQKHEVDNGPKSKGGSQISEVSYFSSRLTDRKSLTDQNGKELSQYAMSEVQRTGSEVIFAAQPQEKQIIGGMVVGEIGNDVSDSIKL